MALSYAADMLVQRVLATCLFAACVGVSACGAASEPRQVASPELSPSVMRASHESPSPPCALEFAPSGAPHVDIARLGRACGAHAGLQPLTPMRLTRQAQTDAVQRFTFQALRAGDCFQAYAVGETSMAELHLRLLSPSYALVAADWSRGAVAMTPPVAPVCLADPGTYVVEVNVTRGEGQVALQVWSAAAGRFRAPGDTAGHKP